MKKNGFCKGYCLGGMFNYLFRQTFDVLQKQFGNFAKLAILNFLQESEEYNCLLNKKLVTKFRMTNEKKVGFAKVSECEFKFNYGTPKQQIKILRKWCDECNV